MEWPWLEYFHISLKDFFIRNETDSPTILYKFISILSPILYDALINCQHISQLQELLDTPLKIQNNFCDYFIYLVIKKSEQAISCKYKFDNLNLYCYVRSKQNDIDYNLIIIDIKTELPQSLKNLAILSYINVNNIHHYIPRTLLSDINCVKLLLSMKSVCYTCLCKYCVKYRNIPSFPKF